ncbi:hypothetical protein D1610_06970 [Sphingomonas gilva]|uniref:PBP domain-containing protein n=1 Tax=Sphingomonas gilva TaxID=2305907 RepID=A0A396RQI1_9SPHN|nr:substrate-binding domain-containing protein [Sphingomonas gilva]RHW18216.1 hypothetical protein D1610_06970 [Sphingomonas gilva]
MNAISVSTFRKLWAIIALLFSISVATPALAEPAYVVVKLPAGATPPAGLAQSLASWRQSGQVSDVLWLDQDQRAEAGFETFVALEFPSEVHYNEWLRDGRAALAAPLQVVPVDVLTHGEKTPRDSNRSVFKVNSYLPKTPPERMGEYAQGYIKPLMDGQIKAGVMMRYTMYLERIPNGQTWLVMEYRDPVAFERSEAVKGELRPRLLQQNKSYAAFDRIKETLRDDGTETVAAYAELPPPALPNLPGYKPDGQLTGSLRIVGSELKNAVDQLAEGFMQFHPGVKVSTSHIPSSEGGIAGLYLGVSDVAPMGDDAKITDMMPFFNTFGYMPTEISVATGGYEKRGSLFAWAIVVNKDNPLEEITLDELDRVFGAERTGGWERINNNYLYSAKYARGPETNIRRWSQLGVKGDLANKEIQTFGYVAPGFAVAIERHLMHWSHKYNPNFREFVEAKQAAPGSEGSVASTVALEQIAKDKSAIGIAALMHVKNQPNLKVLRVSPGKGKPAVALTPDDVANRLYPLIRDAYFYVNKAPDRPLDPNVREFMRFVLSREGQEIIARVGYYYPLSAPYLAEQRKKLD